MAQYHKAAPMRPTPCPPLVVNTVAKLVPRKANFLDFSQLRVLTIHQWPTACFANIFQSKLKPTG